MPFRTLFNRTIYAYVKNLQGDVVGILDSTGNMVVEYKYDAWGAPISISSESTAVDDLAFDNPFRYRGYVWDEETGLYYLRSRYYYSEINRFINVDALINATALSLFTYCKDNPVLYKDTTGLASVIDMEFVFDKNYFYQFINFDTEKMHTLIASGDYEGIPCLVNQNFKAISGHDFYIPGIKIFGIEPCCVEFEYYVQYREVQNLTSGTTKAILGLLSAEMMDELIDFAAYHWGIPIDGALVSNIAEGVLHYDEYYEPLLDDYQTVTVHTVRIKYNYESFGSVYANYQFYESIDGSNNCYDGVHACAEYRAKNGIHYAFVHY